MKFSLVDIEVVARKKVFQGFFCMEELMLRHRTFEGGWTDFFKRELFIRGDAVGVLLHDPKNRLVGLIEQFRVGALKEPGGPWLLELVAGMVEPGETPEQVAKRELHEEAGIVSCQLEPVCSYLVSPGGCDEKFHLFCGITDLTAAEGRFGLATEQEDIYLHTLGEEEAFSLLDQGGISNAATIIALQWLQKRCE